MILVICRSDGTIYSLDEQPSIAKIIADGYGEWVTGEYVIHRINYEIMKESPPNDDLVLRLASCPSAFGFQQYGDMHLWGTANPPFGMRGLAVIEIGRGNITQDDYNFIDGLLPE